MAGVAVWVGVALSAVLIAEVCARLLFRLVLRPVVHLPGQRLLIPVLDELRTHLDAAVDYQVNARGERGDDVRGGTGCYRVLILGGSAAECRLLAQKASLGGYLQERLRQPDALAITGTSAVHVGVLAKSMLTARDLCRMMEGVLPFHGSLNTIVFVCGLADVKRWLEAAAPPGPIPPPADDSEIFDQYPGMTFTVHRPALLRLALRAWTRYRRPVTRMPTGSYVVRERRARQQVVRFEPLASDPRLMLDEYRRSLRDMIELAHRHAAAVVVGCQGWLEMPDVTAEESGWLWGGRIGSPRAAGPPRFIRHDQMRELFRRIRTVTLEVAAECGVASVDLSVVENSFGAYYDDIHYASRGAKQAADAIARTMLKT